MKTLMITLALLLLVGAAWGGERQEVWVYRNAGVSPYINPSLQYKDNVFVGWDILTKYPTWVKEHKSWTLLASGSLGDEWDWFVYENVDPPKPDLSGTTIIFPRRNKPSRIEQTNEAWGGEHKVSLGEPMGKMRIAGGIPTIPSMPEVEPSGTTTEWLGYIITYRPDSAPKEAFQDLAEGLYTVSELRSSLMVWERKYQLGLRSDGAVVWRKLKED